MSDNNEKAIKVYLVNPPIETPWRTKEDYINEQKRDTFRFYITIITLIIAILSLILTTYLNIQK